MANNINWGKSYCSSWWGSNEMIKTIARLLINEWNCGHEEAPIIIIKPHKK